MQPNCSLPCSHQPATRIHATDFHPISLTWILILSFHLYLCLLNFFVAQVSHQEIPMHSSALSWMPHALSISSPQSYVHTVQMITKNRSACACRRECMALWEGEMRKWRWQETNRRSEGQRHYGKEQQSACKPNTVFCSVGTKGTGTNIWVSSERRRCVVGRDFEEGSGRGQF